jgi:hypothetical protein
MAKGGGRIEYLANIYSIVFPTTMKKSKNILQIIEPFAELSSIEYNIATTKARLIEEIFERK